jgi:hypothetical protein
MYRKDIIKILGEPGKIVTDEYDEKEKRLDWNYLKIKLTLLLAFCLLAKVLADFLDSCFIY